MEKKYEKIPVIIYVRYDSENEEDWPRKEQYLKDYCNLRGYKVIDTFRDLEPRCEYFSETLINIIKEKSCKYLKLIALDINELADSDDQVHALFWLLLEKEVRIETVKEGSLGEDFLFGITTHRNVMKKQELIKAESINFASSIF